MPKLGVPEPALFTCWYIHSSLCYADADLLVLHNYYQILVAALSSAFLLNRS